MGVDDFEWIDLYKLEVNGIRILCAYYASPTGEAKGVMLEKEARKIEGLIEKVKDGVDEGVLNGFVRRWSRLAGYLNVYS